MPFDELITVERDGKHSLQMKSGRAVLPRFQGEKPLYDTAEEADTQAANRSQYEYDEVRRDPANQWSMPDTPAPPLLDVPGQSMLKPEAIGKRRSMYNPDDAIETISSGLQALEMGSLNEHGFDQPAHMQRALSSGPFADINSRHAAWGRETAPLQVAGLDTMTGQRKLLPSGQHGSGGVGDQLRALDAEDAATQVRKDTSGATMGQSPIAPLWTDAEKKARIPAPRKQTEVDPYEGMDPELKAAVIAEEKRNKRR